jgi:hypothetical protein
MKPARQDYAFLAYVFLLAATFWVATFLPLAPSWGLGPP